MENKQTTGSRNKKRKFRNRSFCMLEPDLIESDAFRDLSGKWAVVVLIRFHQKARRRKPGRKHQPLHRYIITNNGEIIFTYGEAKEMGIKSDRTFHRVIRELVEEKGFIDIAEQGNWYEGKPTQFAISRRWKRYGSPDYKKVEIPRQLPRSLGFQKDNEK